MAIELFDTKEAAEAAKQNPKDTVVECNVETVLGEKIPKITKYVVASQHASIQAAKDAGDWPSESAVLKFVNTKQVNLARQNAIQQMTADVRAKIVETPEYRENDLVKQILAKNPKLDEAKARKTAKAILAME